MADIPRSTDVLVIGAGPAGGCVARWVAERGYSVLLVDRRFNLGQPVLCGEYVAPVTTRNLPLSKAAVEAVAASTSVHWKSSVDTFWSPGYFLRRDIFDRDLAVGAVRAGARLATGATLLDADTSSSVAEIRLRSSRTTVPVGYKILVGADGPRSTVRRIMGLPPAELAHAGQHEVVLKRPAYTADFYFREELAGGYGWVFAKGNTANVGIIAGREVTAPELDEFLSEVTTDEFACDGALRSIVAPIPRFDPAISPGIGNTLLCGDAAGFVDNLTYGGDRAGDRLGTAGRTGHRRYAR